MTKPTNELQGEDMIDEERFCIGCTTKLLSIDDDPNGDKNSKCLRCHAEEEHDFDTEPNVEFNRLGYKIKPTGGWEEIGLLDDGARKYKHTITELSFFVHPQRGTYDFNGLPCAVRSDGTLNIVDKHPVDTVGKLLLGKI